MSELLVFEDVDMKESEGQWPMEVLVTVGEGSAGQLTVLDRDSLRLGTFLIFECACSNSSKFIQRFIGGFS